MFKGYIGKYKNYSHSRKFIKYYEMSVDPEIIKMKDYIIKNKRFDIFNYPFQDKYDDVIEDIKIFKDELCGLFYINYNGRPLYFKRDFNSPQKVLAYYKTLLVEQDLQSPHRYLTDNFIVERDSVVVDVGGAEGNFSLDIVDSCKKVIIVESEIDWIEALSHTFENEINSGKVVLINKMLTDRDTDKTISLDSIMDKYGKIDFVKMDIEGGEQTALMGAKRLLAGRKNIKLVICTYHTQNAEKEIIELLGDNFKYSFSDGYMCMNHLFGFVPPYVRHGVLRAESL